MFPTRQVYADRVLPDRLRKLRLLFEENRPAFVFAYGKNYWPYYEEVFGASGLDDFEPGRVRLGMVRQTCVVLTHFFSRYFMTDQRIDAIALRIEALGGQAARAAGEAAS